MAFWRNDLEAVDGFDAAFTGWGREDSDIFVRLIRAGVRRKDGALRERVLHLWHREADRSGLDTNERQLAEVIAVNGVKAQRGLSGATRPRSTGAQSDAIIERRRGDDAPPTSPASTISGATRCRASPMGSRSWSRRRLPWSTSATGILSGLWLLATLPTLMPRGAATRSYASAPGGLPVLLCFRALGMAWADVSVAERLHGLDCSFLRLMTIPMLLAQFRRSTRGCGRHRVPGLGDVLLVDLLCDGQPLGILRRGAVPGRSGQGLHFPERHLRVVRLCAVRFGSTAVATAAAGLAAALRRARPSVLRRHCLRRHQPHDADRHSRALCVFGLSPASASLEGGSLPLWSPDSRRAPVWVPRITVRARVSCRFHRNREHQGDRRRHFFGRAARFLEIFAGARWAKPR